MSRIACALLLLLALPARADPLSALTALQPFIGGTLAAFFAPAASFIVSNIGAISLLGFGLATGAYQRRQQRKAAARAKAQHNASLTDRAITVLQADPPWPIVYGRAITGGTVVAVLTTDKTTKSLQQFPPRADKTKPDALKHCVIVVAAHEVEAIHDVRIDGVSIGPLDANGYPTAGPFLDGKTTNHRADFTGSCTLGTAVGTILQAYRTDQPGTAVTVTLSNANKTLTGPAGVPVSVDYTVTAGEPTIRVIKYLGGPTQTASAYLMGLAPAKWTSNHRLQGLAYCVVTLDLTNQRFQGGIPALTFDVSGRKVFDPRSNATAWSANPALCLRDFLTAPWGYECDASDIDDAYTIAAANACDVSIPLDIGGTVTNGPTYTCNGAFNTAESRESMLEEMCEGMAGSAVYGSQWMLQAGAWTLPVTALTDDHLDGQIEVLQAGASMDAMFNGVRGQYVPAGAGAPTDFDPYSNAVFVSADGRPLWDNITLPFTDNKARAKNLARIRTERARSSQVIRYPAKLSAWGLRIGERVTVTSAEYGLSAKPYRVTDWQFGLDAPVVLTLQEDAAEIWDLADASTADPTPNTNLPSPFIVQAISGAAADSGTAHLLRQADGTITTRVWVSWAPVTDGYVVSGGHIAVDFLPQGADQWSAAAEAPGDATGVYLLGAQDASFIVIRVRAVNPLDIAGPPAFIGHRVVGKTAPPSNVAGLTAAVGDAGIVLEWAPCADADYRDTELRRGGTDWATSIPLLGTAEARVAGTRFVWPKPSAGNYIVRARHRDTSGNYSAADATVNVTVDAAALLTWGTIAGRPKLYRVRAEGGAGTGGTGLFNGESGANLFGYGRSYMMARIDRASGAVTFSRQYDVYGNGEFTPGINAATLAADLNATAAGTIVVVYTFDEPMAERLTGGLPAAMYRCGASRAIFGSPQVKVRSAYTLVGVAGCGEGNGFEAYQGAIDDDPNAWCEVAFQIVSGQLIVSGNGATPRTLADYAYVGDLNATYGAQFGVNISGQAQTGDIAPGSVTATLISRTAEFDCFGSRFVAVSLRYTADYASRVLVTTSGVVDQFIPLGQMSTFAKLTNYALAPNGGTFEQVARNADTGSPYATGSLSFADSYDISAGETMDFFLYVTCGHSDWKFAADGQERKSLIKGATMVATVQKR